MKPLLILNTLIVILLIDFLIYTGTNIQAKGIDSVQSKNLREFKEVNRSFYQGNYKKASKILDKLSRSSDLNDLEKAHIAGFLGNICFYKKDIGCSITKFKNVLEYKDAISEEYYFEIVNLLAKLYFTEKEYLRAISYAEQYLSSKPHSASDTNMIIAQSYFALKNHQSALDFALQGFANIDTANVQLKSGAIYFLIYTYKELNQLEKAYEFVESMDKINPTTKYKLRIAELYEGLGMEDKAKVIHENLIHSKLAGYSKDGELIVWNSEGILLPRFRPNPSYPKKALDRGQEGWVDFMIDINKSGETENIRIIDTSHRKTFDKSATKAVEGYIFDPQIKNGQIVAVKDYELRISFQLSGRQK